MMLRTTVNLPFALHQRLIIASKQEKLSLSQIIGDLLDKALAAQDKIRLQRMYGELRKLDGASKIKVTDASTTINEVLYGEYGAWRGRREE
jgi:hypothetical protein